jgi:hypothetical protein
MLRIATNQQALRAGCIAINIKYNIKAGKLNMCKLSSNTRATLRTASATLAGLSFTLMHLLLPGHLNQISAHAEAVKYSDIPVNSSGNDVITDFNKFLLQLFRQSSVDPELAAYASASMNVSAFDAINSVAGDYKSYAYSGKQTGPVSLSAAAAQAAHDALQGLWFFKGQRTYISTFLAHQLGKIPDGAAKLNGIRVGKEAALALSNKRQDDMAITLSMDGWNPPTGGNPPNPCIRIRRGCWGPTPPNNLPVDKPRWGEVKPFAIPMSNFINPKGPPPLESKEYANLFNQVKAIGKDDSNLRSRSQTEIAIFWSEQESGQRTPPGSWLAIASTLAKQNNLTLIQRSRLFALLSLAMADSGINAWKIKNKYNFWRPVTAIRLAAEDGNPDTIPDPNWNSLLPAPNFQGYYSGHSDFGWSAATVIIKFFGTDALNFTVTSDSLPLTTLVYNSVTRAASDNGIARVFLGVHFNNENLDAAESGKKIGSYVYENYLQPLK